jgi:flagellar hook-associated protein 3 FlgL
VQIVLQSTLVGNVASAAFNAGTNTLTISLDATQTTANTILNAVNSEGTLTASLATASDPGNNGSGIPGFTGVAATTAGGTADAITTDDLNRIEVNGVFSAIIRLQEAFRSNDLAGVERATRLLDTAYDRVSFSRAELGARSQSLDIARDRLLDEENELKANLSQDFDVDIIEAISNLNARQLAYEASLKLSAGLYRTSLLDFL